MIEQTTSEPKRDRPLKSEEVLKDLSSIVVPVYQALERAIQDAKTFFPEAKPIDPFLFPNLVRYYALDSLEMLPKEEDWISIERLSNNGICIAYRDYRIRVWKADEGELPAAGNSESRLHFFEQPDLFPDMRLMKLAIIWDTTTKGTLKTLMLVCPKGDGNPSNQAGQIHWQIEIPHPASRIIASEVFEPSVDDIELEAPINSQMAKTYGEK